MFKFTNRHDFTTNLRAILLNLPILFTSLLDLSLYPGLKNEPHSSFFSRFSNSYLYVKSTGKSTIWFRKFQNIENSKILLVSIFSSFAYLNIFRIFLQNLQLLQTFELGQSQQQTSLFNNNNKLLVFFLLLFCSSSSIVCLSILKDFT